MALYVPTSLAFIALLLLFVANVQFKYHFLRFPSYNRRRTSFSPGDAFLDVQFSSSSNSTIAHHLYQLTLQPHVAGSPQNFDTAQYVLSTFSEYGLHSTYRDYEVLLSYPLSRSLSLTNADGDVVHCSLQETQFDDDPYSKDPDIIPTFHAYAPSGTVVSEAVFVNYGRVEDYEVLRQMGVDVSGAIVVAKYGNIYRGDIVALAAKAGAAAAIIYSDPMDYGCNGTQGYYPSSRWLPPKGVQRGTVFSELGDPLTPGWPSTSNAERLPLQGPSTKLPTIPSLPISAEDVLPILKHLEGPVAPSSWHGGLDIPTYHLGRGPSRLNLSYTANQTVHTIRNVFGIIRGSAEPDRYVLLGNHRDAWTFGAVDPNSGTAVLLEVARRLGSLQKKGWRPQRTIYLCSWDAEEYGLIGSTEWVEENYELLSARGVAYLNVDSAVAGPGFFADATPQLDGLLKEITKKIRDPDDHLASLYDSWVRSQNSSCLVGRLGGTGSDYAPFLQHAGVSAVDLRFGGSYPVYHSSYDNYNWMLKFGDPLFNRHVAVAEVLGMMALELVDASVLPFDYGAYATELQAYAENLNSQLEAGVSLGPLYSAISDFRDAAQYVMQEIKLLKGSEDHAKELLGVVLQKRSLNDRLLLAERAFLDAEGLPRGICYKHLVYGPTTNNDYASSSFPGVEDAISAAKNAINTSNRLDVQHEIWRVARATTRAALALRGELICHLNISATV